MIRKSRNVLWVPSWRKSDLGQTVMFMEVALNAVRKPADLAIEIDR